MNRYNRGVYAGSLRYHDGRYWMFTTTPNEGIFMTTALDPAGPWSPLVKLSGGKDWDDRGWDDCCPLWDDGGQAYLVISNPGQKQKWWTHLFKMSADGRSIDPASDFVVDDHPGSEGNKIYKINGLYCIFHNHIDGPNNRTGVFMRAKSLRGPWEKNFSSTAMARSMSASRTRADWCRRPPVRGGSSPPGGGWILRRPSEQPAAGEMGGRLAHGGRADGEEHDGLAASETRGRVSGRAPAIRR